MIDTIHYLGNRLLALGHSTPFLVFIKKNNNSYYYFYNSILLNLIVTVL